MGDSISNPTNEFAKNTEPWLDSETMHHLAIIKEALSHQGTIVETLQMRLDPVMREPEPSESKDSPSLGASSALSHILQEIFHTINHHTERIAAYSGRLTI